MVKFFLIVFFSCVSLKITAQNIVINGSFEEYKGRFGPEYYLDSIYYISGPGSFTVYNTFDKIKTKDSASDGKVYLSFYLWKLNNLYVASDVNIKGDLLLMLDTNWNDKGQLNTLRKFVLKIDVRTSENSSYTTNKLNYRFINYPNCGQSKMEVYNVLSAGKHKSLCLTDHSFFPKSKWVTLIDTVTFLPGERYDFIYIGGIPSFDIIEFRKMKGKLKHYIYIDIDNIIMVPLKE